jgi:hypothetical protein
VRRHRDWRRLRVPAQDIALGLSLSLLQIDTGSFENAPVRLGRMARVRQICDLGMSDILKEN